MFNYFHYIESSRLVYNPNIDHVLAFSNCNSSSICITGAEVPVAADEGVVKSIGGDRRWRHALNMR